jgi:hypothetical protein
MNALFFPPDVRPFAPSVAFIQSTVAAAFGSTRAELISERRTRAAVVPRHVAMLLARELTRHNLASLGRLFRRDHTTVISGLRSIERRLQEDRALAQQVDQLRSVIVATTGPDAWFEPNQQQRRRLPSPNGDFLPGPLFDFAEAR